MITQELLDYINHHLAVGQNKEAIKNELLGQGWDEATLEQAFASVSPAIPVPVSTPPATPIGTGHFASAGEIFKQAWGIYKQRFWTLIGISIIPSLLILGGALLLGGGGFLLLKFGGNFSPTSIIGGSLIVGLLFLLLFLAFIYIVLWSQVALLVAVKDHEERIGFKEAFKRASHKIGSFFWVGILNGLIVLGGFILLFVPGIIFWIWYSLSLYVLVGENIKGVQALQKSKTYVQGKWWSVLWRFLFILILTLIVYAIIGLLGRMSDDKTVSITIQIINNIIIFLFTPLTIVYSYLVYHNLKLAKGAVAVPAKKTWTIVGLMWGLIVIPLIGLIVSGGFWLKNSLKKSPSFGQGINFEQNTIIPQLSPTSSDNSMKPTQPSDITTTPIPNKSGAVPPPSGVGTTSATLYHNLDFTDNNSGLQFKVNGITATQLNVTITDIKTGSNQTVLLELNAPKIILNHNFMLSEIKEVNQGTINGQPIIGYQAKLIYK